MSNFMRGTPILTGSNTTPGEKLTEKEKELFTEVLKKCSDYGLDYYPTVIQKLNYDEMSEVAAYGGFPKRYLHWSHGMEYEKLSKGYEYGMYRIYEMVINCLFSCTRVLTNKGSKTVKEVSIGDRIMGPTGWRNVVGVKSRSNSKVRKIKLNELSMDLICTPEHKWKCYRNGKGIWLETKDIIAGDVILAGSKYEFNLNNPAIFNWNFDNVLKETRPNIRNRLKPIDAPSQMTLQLAELLGIITGDGSQGVRLADNNISVCVHKSQTEYINYIKKLFDETFNIESKIYKKPKSVDTINLSSKYAVDFLNAIGFKKSSTYKTKRVPWSIWVSSNEYKAAYLRGVFDTDGYCGKYLSVSCYSDDLAQDIQLLLLEIGIRSKFKRIKDKYNDIAVLTIKGKSNVRKFAKYVGFNLKYKQDALRDLCDKDGRSGRGYYVFDGLINLVFEK